MMNTIILVVYVFLAVYMVGLGIFCLVKRSKAKKKAERDLKDYVEAEEIKSNQK